MLNRDGSPRAWWLADEYKGINYRRAVKAYDIVRANPGKTAWELASLSGIIYADMSKGLQKGREHGLFRFESEDRNQGGVRYRYWAIDDIDANVIFKEWHDHGFLDEPASAKESK